MKILSSSNPTDQFGKDQIKFLLKIKEYETKNEFNRFLLITSFGGILSIIAGFIELIFYKFYSKDVIFFQFNFFQSSDPVLLGAIWILTIFPILVIILFTTGTTGIINWNKTYKNIGYIAIILFVLSELSILFASEDHMELIPIIWGFYIFVGFLIAGTLMYKYEKQLFLARLLIFYGIVSLANAFFSYLFIDKNLAMFYMLDSFGMLLVVTTGILYIFETRFTKIENKN